MRIRRLLGRTLLNLAPKYSRTAYEWCERYVDRFNADNIGDPVVNGEYLFLRNALLKLKSPIVFDVGANVGDWARAALSVSPDIVLHCFEPSKRTSDELRRKSWPPTTRINHCALGNAEGEAQLHVVEGKSTLNSLYLRQGVKVAVATGTEQVTVTTVDKYCERNAIDNIDLIKVDVEGHELAVFEGMERMLAEGRVALIQFEYGGCNLDARVHLADIWHFLQRFGFKLAKLYPEGPRYIERYDQRLETFKYSNWIAVR